MLTLIQPVENEPVNLDDAMLQLRIDGDDLEDELALALITARLEAEHYCGRSFAPQGWRLTRSDWWVGGLELPRGPVVAVSKVEYLAPDGTWYTINAGNYTLDDDRLYWDLNYTLPRLMQRDDVVRIEYTTGTWAPADEAGDSLPEGIKRAITMLAQSTFDSLVEQPETLRERAFALLRPYRRDSGLAAA